jgi:hypothetical protein
MNKLSGIAYFLCLKVNKNSIRLIQKEHKFVKNHNDDLSELLIINVPSLNSTKGDLYFNRKDFNSYWVNELPKGTIESKVWLTDKKMFDQAIIRLTIKMDEFVNKQCKNERLIEIWNAYCR